MIRSYVQAILLPGIIGLTLGTTIIFSYMNVDPDLWVLYTYNATAILLTILEYVFPRNPSWNYLSKDGIKFKEATLETGFYFYGEALGKSILMPIASLLVERLKTVWNIPVMTTAPRLSFLGVFQIIFLFLLIDFIRYWIHRWEHNYSFLWRFHALHHMAPRLSAVSATRSHPVDDLILYLPETVLVLLLGFDEQLVAGMYSVIWVISLVKHANIELKINCLSRYFQLPRYHLIHHELHAPTDPTYNFAEITILWDYIFGTFKNLPLTAQHSVGVETKTRRGVFRELLGSFYLPTDKL